MRLCVSELHWDVDSLQKLLRHSPTEFVYEAKLSLDYISTEKHPPMEFTLEGWLSHNGLKTWVSGDGELHCGHMRNRAVDSRAGVTLCLVSHRQFA